MTRPKLRAGQLGAIQTIELPSGRFQARALLADELGKARRVKASGETEDAAVAALRARAEAIRSESGGPTISLNSTIAQACVVFLHDKEHSGTVEDSTLDVYEATIRNVIEPVCGELTLRDLTVRRCNRIFAQIRESRSLSAARKARSVLSQVCLTGVEYDILTSNPVRDARRLPLPKKKTSVLIPEQLVVVQRLMQTWRLSDGRGPRPNVTVLENGMWIMVGTSQRIGEVLALRRCDVDITASPPTVLVDATIQYSKKQGSMRKGAAKRARQKRRVALPSFAAAAIRNQLARTSIEAKGALFATRAGKPMSVSNFQRLLRAFVNDNEHALRKAGIDTDAFSTHIFRRTAATIVEAAAGITLASRLLGHANEQVTRNSYVVTAEMVDPVTASILEDALTGIL